jgi:glycosyltransferase involved in cell wall biosynthesis
MSCGTPMVAPDVDGIRGLVIDGETGLLFRHGDEASFGAALARVLSDPTGAAAMRERARRLALARMTAGAVAIDLRECFVETSPRL